MDECLKTPLYDAHVALNGKMVPFAGFLLPIQYASGIVAEHNAVRTRVGMFDVSHMGEIMVTGADALNNLNRLSTNDFTSLAPGRARYTVLCAENGGAIDDLLIYCLTEHRYMIVANASNAKAVYAHVTAEARGDVHIENISDNLAQIAVQGPAAAQVMATLCENLPTKNYTFVEHAAVARQDCLLSRTGYTGEDGFEIYCAPNDARAIWDALMTVGVTPCGLGARDTLRLEAAMPLYGHELSREITPFEAGLSAFVKLEKSDFIGRDALTTLPTRRRIGLNITGRGIAREGCRVLSHGIDIGYVTSGTFAPNLGYPIAMALVTADADLTDITVMIREKPVSAEVVGLPFYKRGKV